MKIYFIIGNLGGGGAERVMTTLANGFSKTNEVSLITFYEGEGFSIDPNVQRVKLHHGKTKNQTVRAWFNLYHFIRKKNSKPDIIITFMPRNALIVIPIAKIFGIKVVVSEHTNHLTSLTPKTKFIRNYLYPFASAITILTKYDLSFYKRKNKKVFIVPNPLVHPTELKPFIKRKKNILAAGSLNRYQDKGFDSLLRIAAPLLEEHKDWTLTIAGSGEQGIKELANLSKELNIDSQVFLPGFCNNLKELMQNSQVFALPSKFEGLPMVLMEALSNGMACIAYDCISGPSELIEDKNNGLLIKDQDSKAFQNGLKELILNNSLRIKLAENGPDSMRPYLLDEILNLWESLFQEISSDS
ncbi:MAG: glycosyltransferase family 4 protein [Allomuricauda sp.]|jgi:GalNAc-alpha-(1->4)-GalNAc-alpha-(1->3)-diNAcBac-PP-undecaprenol alpha-1,4-N-acetyl-D-galactosaminyltransferase|uniref:glycosyltransferase family 4 protein n=1 Tax=Allomuricauda sp. ARW1Y1 TaxID=2663843 RepID=UPI0015C8452F|nr:glycosyltransferase family 4 protein [Muricauda sp. ARW1Y1]NYJ28041.1 GalNAc-alpha-(1->4)-GalNAc-alpha-(1->3)-diNAcBac-PP-undecaprenol alpha-1,4-N-acetyl-D-galactosaminyltransferase [Muricauda sp. ARW1Y1]